jgi:hypothetical protein
VTGTDQAFTLLFLLDVVDLSQTNDEPGRETTLGWYLVPTYTSNIAGFRVAGTMTAE